MKIVVFLSENKSLKFKFDSLAINRKVYEYVRDNEHRQWRRRKASRKADDKNWVVRLELYSLRRLKVIKWEQILMSNNDDRQIW